MSWCCCLSKWPSFLSRWPSNAWNKCNQCNYRFHQAEELRNHGKLYRKLFHDVDVIPQHNWHLVCVVLSVNAFNLFLLDLGQLSPWLQWSSLCEPIVIVSVSVVKFIVVIVIVDLPWQHSSSDCQGFPTGLQAAWGRNQQFFSPIRILI